ncbi:receptortyrosineR-likeproteintype phosphatase non-receptor type 5-like [Argonauta hians]
MGYALLTSSMLFSSGETVPNFGSLTNNNLASLLLLPVVIPKEFTVYVTFGIPVSKLNFTQLTSLRIAFSKILHIPRSHIGINRILILRNSIEMFFISFFTSGLSVQSNNLMKASYILTTPHLLEKLQWLLPDLHIIQVGTEPHVMKTSVSDEPFWTQPYFPYVMATLAAAVTTLLVTLLVYCCYRRRKKSALQPAPVQTIFYPSLKPNMRDAMMVQPESSPVYVVKRCVTPLPAQTPVQMRAEGLLKRRGSSASLTLDLNPSPELPRWEGTPPKESSGLEFLMSAGNRLSRKDLRNAVNNVSGVYEEFWDIPSNHPEKVYVAGSGTKNRYKTMIPNEHSRVILPNYEGDTLSSYINANYIRGYEVEAMAYIATQGPMAHTILDFWRMIWHEKAPIIVMITKLKEMNTADLFNSAEEKEEEVRTPWNSPKSKCENYLPEKFGCYGDIEVSVEKVTQRPGYVVHQLILKCKGESHPVLHYWYTAWPDHKPPDSPKMILDLVQDVELHRYMEDGITPRGPIVVHCSAGIGRTGCFIAISIGIRQLREEHSVDILGIVCSMRMDRGGMIQTHEQYEFIHQALCEYEKILDSTAD